MDIQPPDSSSATLSYLVGSSGVSRNRMRSGVEHGNSTSRLVNSKRESHQID